MIGNSSIQFDLRVPWGSQVNWTMLMYNSSGIVPFPDLASHTFEYLVKANVTDTNPVIRLRSDQPGSPTPAGGGLITVNAGANQSSVVFQVYPPGTSALTPPLSYYHAMWMDYADPVNATCLWWGQWYLDPAIQP